jgi:hypothetical protein
MKVYLIVRQSTQYGDSWGETILGRSGPHDTLPFHPGFSTLEKAEAYLEKLKFVYGLTILEHQIQ